jgi:hypothetical protein
MSSASCHRSYQKKQFDDHVANCDGKNEPQFKLDEHSSRYLPHFFKNKLYAFLYANNRLEEYRFLDEYLTYDLRVLERIIARVA